ncbi:MAG: hypothetical protein KAV82_14605, partial [Phycisphaerae bacterium]|nr:hypothetical protein [Phycisphaerae bacterium]
GRKLFAQIVSCRQSLEQPIRHNRLASVQPSSYDYSEHPEQRVVPDATPRHRCKHTPLRRMREELQGRISPDNRI